MKEKMPPFVILGCGYVGTRLAQSLLKDGAQVRVCARRVALLEPLRQLGAQVQYLDAGRAQQFGPALQGLDQPVVVYAIPGVADMPQGEAVRRAAAAALRVHARGMIYLGSSSVYGRSEGVNNADWVDEETSVATVDPEATARLGDEAAVQSVAQGGLRTMILRLAAVYGPMLHEHQPARGVRQRLRSGQYRLYDGGRYYFSRIHVDDLVRIIRLAAEKVVMASELVQTFVVGDDHPCTQAEYAGFLTSHLGLPMPPSVASHMMGGVGNAVRGRRLHNQRIKKALGLTLLYPTYREGELHLDVCEKSGLTSAPQLSATDSEPVAVVEKSTEVPKPLQLVEAKEGADLGAQVGVDPLAAEVLKLQPGRLLTLSRPAMVLRGTVSVMLNSRSGHGQPLHLLPKGVTVQADGDAECLLLLLGR